MKTLRHRQSCCPGLAASAGVALAITLCGFFQGQPLAQAWAQPDSRALGLIPPNASRVVATVIAEATWPPGSLLGSRPPVHPDETLYSLTIRIEEAAQAALETSSMAQPGMAEAFSTVAPPPGLAGRRVEALLELRGDTHASRWWISHIRVIP